jgi:hypothetical protein
MDRRNRGLPIPIDIFGKEWMAFNFLTTVSAQTFRGVPLKETRHYTSRFRRHIGGEVERVLENALVHRVDILVIERWKTGLEMW